MSARRRGRRKQKEKENKKSRNPYTHLCCSGGKTRNVAMLLVSSTSAALQFHCWNQRFLLLLLNRLPGGLLNLVHQKYTATRYLHLFGMQMLRWMVGGVLPNSPRRRGSRVWLQPQPCPGMPRSGCWYTSNTEGRKFGKMLKSIRLYRILEFYSFVLEFFNFCTLFLLGTRQSNEDL